MEMKKKQQIPLTVNFKKNSFEVTAWRNNSVVVGIDEVGRGCLAGPLVTAAVILPPYAHHPLLKDSKIMTPQERQKAFNWIKKRCCYETAIVHNRIIDKHNIWQTTLIAMKKALINVSETCHVSPSAILIDAMPLDISDTHLYDIPVHRFYYGESKSTSIAAASIVAKVTRDALMKSFDCIIPGYKLANNKGYATATHKNALKEQKHSIIHRMRFLKKVLEKNNSQDLQLSLETLNIFNEEMDSDETGEIFCGSN
jgi:ribonuclease HII